MTSRLPFEPLRAFIHAASSGSFKKAADELNLSPGAVSQRIAHLEEYMGTSLFYRHARKINLTRAGHNLIRETKLAVLTLEATLGQPIDKEATCVIRLETIPSFAANWLMPKLPDFYKQCPEIKISTSINCSLTDLNRREIDLAIRYGRGAYPRLCSYRLFAPQSVIIGKSDIFLSDEPLLPSVCEKISLLRDGQLTEWEEWLSYQEIAETNVTWGPSFADDALLIQAVERGDGLAIVRKYSAQKSIDSGAVRVLFDTTMENTYGFFLVGLQDVFDRKDIQSFRDWLMKQFRPYPESSAE